MTKEKYGKSIYIGSLIVAVLIFVVGKILLQKYNMTETNYIRYQNLLLFGIFGFILPLGIMAREFFLLKYNKKIMVFKLVMFIVILIGGLFLFYIVPTISMSSIILYFSYGSIILILIPSNSYYKNKNL